MDSSSRYESIWLGTPMKLVTDLLRTCLGSRWVAPRRCNSGRTAFRLSLLWLFVAPITTACHSPTGNPDNRPIAGAHLSIVPTKSTLGTMMVGTEYETKISVQNSRTEAVSAAVQVTPPWLEARPSVMEIAADSATEVTLLIKPSSIGNFEADFTIESSEGDRASVQLTGESTDQPLELTSSLDFGQVRPGSSQTVDLPIENQTDHQLTVGLQLVGSSSYNVPATSILIPPRAVSSVPVSVQPTELGAIEGDLLVRTCDQCVIYNVSLSASSHSVTLEASLHEIDFGSIPVGARAVREVVLSNGGTTALDLTVLPPMDRAIRIEGSENIRISPDETYTLEINIEPFHPETLDSTIRISDASGEVSVEIPVRATAVDALEAVPPGGLFEQTPRIPFDRTIEIVNLDRSREIFIDQAWIEGNDSDSFELLSAPIGEAIGAESGRFTIRYEAKEGVEEQATLALRVLDSFLDEFRIPLRGRAASTDCELTASHPDIDFGTIPFGSTYSRRFELQNTGIKPCFVWGISAVTETPEPDVSLILTEDFKHIPPGEVLDILIETKKKVPPVNPDSYLLYYSSASGASPIQVPIHYYFGNYYYQFVPSPTTTIDFAQTAAGNISSKSVSIRAISDYGMITDLRFTEDSSDDFRIGLSHQTLPIEIPVGGVSLELEFVPRSPGRAYGRLVVTLWGRKPILFDLVGIGVEE